MNGYSEIEEEKANLTNATSIRYRINVNPLRSREAVQTRVIKNETSVLRASIPFARDDWRRALSTHAGLHAKMSRARHATARLPAAPRARCTPRHDTTTQAKPDGEETNIQTGRGNDAAESQHDDQTQLADGPKHMAGSPKRVKQIDHLR
jgi:hypothetical protein